jgi:glycosyltransferase involved in cell wall biosynthesis
VKIILSHPTGNSFVRAAAKGMLKADALSEFHTSIATFSGDFLDRISNIKWLSELRRRRFEESLKPFTRTWPMIEACRQIASKVGIHSIIKHERGCCSVDAVYQYLDKRVAAQIRKADSVTAGAVYSYEDGAEHTFIQARAKGLLCFYDLPIGYWRASKRLLSIESVRWPQWADTLTGLSDSVEKLERKDRELQLAHRIIVASKFTETTLKEFPGKLPPISVVPYAYPPVFKDRRYDSIGRRPLKLLFVGGLSQRKGIADLFSVTEKLGRYVELTIVGLKTTNACQELNRNLEIHNWIPSLPHHEILSLMRSHDVLVFPSLFEGFGLVITEAMAQGTPVITTERTAGPDLIHHNENGWLIRAGNTDDLLHTIESLINSPLTLIETGKLAMRSAAQRPWGVYEDELMKAISQDY